MATHTPITPSGADEVPHITTASLAFIPILGTLRKLIIAERDLADISYSQDPAYHAWLRDSELAHERLTDTLRDFCALSISHPADQPLLRAVMLIDAILGHEEAGGGRHLAVQMRAAFFSRFQLRGIDPTALHRNALLVQARHLISALAALPLFDACPEATVAVDPADDDSDLLPAF